MVLNNDQIIRLLKLAQKAGEEIMLVYEKQDSNVEFKKDASPLTIADKISHEIIVSELPNILNVPIISEEDESSHSIDTSTFWLVDPLDGTKEFIDKNGEFTINIGLIMDQDPIAGVVHAPALNKTYWTSADGVAMLKSDGKIKKIAIIEKTRNLKAVVSRSHLDDSTKAFLRKAGVDRVMSVGSSLKFCMVAEGTAQIYPRYTPCMLWDTAAADAILRASGGKLCQLNSGREIQYHPVNLTNPPLLAVSKYVHKKFEFLNEHQELARNPDNK